MFNGFEDLLAKMDDIDDDDDDGFVGGNAVKDEWMLPSKIFGAKCEIKKPEDKGMFRGWSQWICSWGTF